MSSLDTTHKVYKKVALTPDVGLCCTTNPIWELPRLKIPLSVNLAIILMVKAIVKTYKLSFK
tara:strand:+ start:464 stop:649 length:186 start_codon:yes stop_codon:yes gene_type:complete